MLNPNCVQKYTIASTTSASEGSWRNPWRGSPTAFSPAAWCQVWSATQTGDDTLKTQANLLLKRQASPINVSACNVRRLPV